MDLTWFQKMLLAVLAGMLVFFGVLMAVFRAHPGVLFEGSLLKITEQDGWIVYSGKVRGEPVDIAVTWPTNFETDVEFTMGERFHDVARVIYPTERIQTEHGDSVGGILITKNEKTLFEGGYDPEAEYGWYDKDGKWAPQTTFQVVFGSSGTDPRHDYENTAGTAVRFAFGPETSAWGDPALFGMAVFLTALLALKVVFHKTLFRWRHWAARNPEPTEEYLALERVGWVVFAIVIAMVYVISVTEIC